MAYPVFYTCFFALILFPRLAEAYVGPGAGAGAIAVTLGVIATVFMAIVGIVWYPIKRVVKRSRSRRDAARGDGPGPADS